MGLFKSKDERRIEREMKIRGGMRAIERSIRQQEKFADDFIKNARRAQQIGDDGQQDGGGQQHQRRPDAPAHFTVPRRRNADAGGAGSVAGRGRHVCGL